MGDGEKKGKPETKRRKKTVGGKAVKAAAAGSGRKDGGKTAAGRENGRKTVFRRIEGGEAAAGAADMEKPGSGGERGGKPERSKAKTGAEKPERSKAKAGAEKPERVKEIGKESSKESGKENSKESEKKSAEKPEKGKRDGEKAKRVRKKAEKGRTGRKTPENRRKRRKKDESSEENGRTPENGGKGEEKAESGKAGEETPKSGPKSEKKPESGKKSGERAGKGKKNEETAENSKKGGEKAGNDEKSGEKAESGKRIGRRFPGGKKSGKKEGRKGKKKTAGAKEGIEPAGKPESGKEGGRPSEKVKTGGNGRTAQSRNPNLKLVKSDRMPVKEETEKKSSDNPPALREAKRKEKAAREKRKLIPPKGYDGEDYAERSGFGEWLVQHKSLVIIWFSVFAVAAALVGAYYYIVTEYKVTTVYVDGNIHYSNEEIMDMVMTGPYGDNSLFLAAKYKDKGVEGVPFVEKMDVNILTPDTIRINVYEKALAGYVEYLGRYMYFDKDGIVVESSQEKTGGIPQVTGLQFGYVVLNEALPVENDAVFKQILSITQLLDKYELSADKIYFDPDYDLTLFFGGVRVTLGAGEEIDRKIMRLQYILPELEGKKGTLPMENYTEDTKLIPFHPD